MLRFNHAEYRVCFLVMLGITIRNVVMLIVAMLNVVTLSVIALSVVAPSLALKN